MLPIAQRRICWMDFELRGPLKPKKNVAKIGIRRKTGCFYVFANSTYIIPPSKNSTQIDSSGNRNWSYITKMLFWLTAKAN